VAGEASLAVTLGYDLRSHGAASPAPELAAGQPTARTLAGGERLGGSS
jgi:hypothetical protein